MALALYTRKVRIANSIGSSLRKYLTPAKLLRPNDLVSFKSLIRVLRIPWALY